MATYKGTAEDGERARKGAKKREAQKEEFDRLKNKLETGASGLREIGDQFTTKVMTYDDQFKASTVGLVTAADFKKKRELVEKMMLSQDEHKAKLKKKAKKRKAKARKKAMSALSFDFEDELDVPKKKSKNEDEHALTKDPNAKTHFLFDKKRDAAEKKLRSDLEDEWKDMQKTAKAELIQITYSYWDGSGHRRTITLEKGATIDKFLEKCRKELCEAFHEMRGVQAENLMYIKEDLIIPHHYSFYDLIISKARGKSGPLFHFDVHDDIRLTGDATIEKDESHAGKVLTRGWYERNKHIFPASRWEVYDPSKVWEKYTIKGN